MKKLALLLVFITASGILAKNPNHIACGSQIHLYMLLKKIQQSTPKERKSLAKKIKKQVLPHAEHMLETLPASIEINIETGIESALLCNNAHRFFDERRPSILGTPDKPTYQALILDFIVREFTKHPQTQIPRDISKWITEFESKHLQETTTAET